MLPALCVAPAQLCYNRPVLPRIRALVLAALDATISDAPDSAVTTRRAALGYWLLVAVLLALAAWSATLPSDDLGWRVFMGQIPP